MALSDFGEPSFLDRFREIVEVREDGSYRVVMDDDRTPRLFISDYYRRRLASGTLTRHASIRCPL